MPQDPTEKALIRTHKHREALAEQRQRAESHRDRRHGHPPKTANVEAPTTAADDDGHGQE